LDKKNRTIAELTGIRIAPRIKAVNPSRFKRIPGCFDKPLVPVDGGGFKIGLHGCWTSDYYPR
jgi:hypothetical protein